MDNSNKAQGFYEEIIAEPIDIKALMAGVSKATKSKAEKNQKLSKKVLKDREKTAKDYTEFRAKQIKVAQQNTEDLNKQLEKAKQEEPKRQALVAKTTVSPQDLKKIQKCELLVRALEDAVRVTSSLSKTLSDILLEDVKGKLDNARESLQRLPSGAARKSLAKRVNLSKHAYTSLQALWKAEEKGLNEEDLQRRRDIAYARQDIASNEAKLKIAREKGKRADIDKYGAALESAKKDLAEAGKSGFRKKAESLIGASRDHNGVIGLRRAAMLALSAVGAHVGSGLRSVASLPGKGYDRGVEALIQRFENSPVMVKSIKTVDKGLRVIGTVLKTTGTETLKWIGKHLSSLARGIWSFIKSPFTGRGGGFDLQDLLGLAVLGPGLIAPLLEGIDKELTERYGEHYIKDFFSGVWATAKDYLTDSLKSFFSGLFNKVTDAATDALKAAEDAIRGTGIETTTAEYVGNPVNPSTAKTPMERARLVGADANFNSRLLAAANDYDGNPNPQWKQDDHKKITEMLSTPATVEAATKQRLDDLGFNTVNLSVRAGSTKFGRPAPAATPAPVDTRPKRRGALNRAPYVAGGGSEPPMESPPVTATPKAQTPTGPVSQAPGNSINSSGGYTVGMIPNNAAPDSLYAYNLGMIG